ncbi:sodium-translocating pyrophosphatase [Brachybacterium fresconis]|uniref:K(+)-insensitive pyrophosphate-energized proton pump n=1 Tax=Brachybacterium fresconis TaxID=173363 RepID=A0ABS4YI41_9MICO|nr:sodium-translocating pyrophosphatase [Brachybacterium fresconis]MBP2408426.1 K(+)-stimulated pyrophosphate-energized sodium pump [Brachybacterium fresconis]
MNPEPIQLSAASLTTVGVIVVIALVAVAMALRFRTEVLRARPGTESMNEVAGAVQEGAAAYLRRQLRTLGVFAVIAFVLLLLLPAHGATGAEGMLLRGARSVAFLAGAAFSGLIGYLGMWLAVRANVRVAAAARETGRDTAMLIAVRTGACVGMATIGFGLLGAGAVVLLFRSDAPLVLEGFGFGAAMVAMFMRVGGGIFTKAADVGADLVGKVEQNIPEDDPRNAATIADNVGDNVGDCAGMAADLFESYAVTLVAALILGRAAFGEAGMVFPLLVPAIGVITALIGIYLTTPRAGESALRTIRRSFVLSAIISAVLCTVAAFVYLPGSFAELGVSDVTATVDDPRILAAGSVAIGIALGVLILFLTGYYTSTEDRPVRQVAGTSRTGAATVVLSGFSLGLESAVFTALVIAAAVFGAFLLGGAGIAGLFAIALAGCGLLTTVGVIVAMDTFGPVTDNAQGIAEMSGDVDGEGAQVLTELDAVGNTTKAITKGIAIATAVLAATALFGSYTDAIHGVLGDRYQDFLDQSVVFAPQTLVGVIIGASVVFLFSGLAISAVGRAAGAVVLEVRRQFREITGIMDGSAKPEYGRVVDIVTRDSLRELATPGLLAVAAPIAVGFGLGAPSLAGYLAGAIAAGVLMAILLANSGGAWDNAKKIVEDGHHGGKGSAAHEATIIGDTVGDPFKDTAGPSINPLIKVMNLVAVLIAPAVVGMSALSGDANPLRYVIAAVAVAAIAVAVTISIRRGVVLDAPIEEFGDVEEAEEADLAARNGLEYSKEDPGSQQRGGL